MPFVFWNLLKSCKAILIRQTELLFCWTDAIENTKRHLSLRFWTECWKTGLGAILALDLKGPNPTRALKPSRLFPVDQLFSVWGERQADPKGANILPFGYPALVQSVFGIANMAARVSRMLWCQMSQKGGGRERWYSRGIRTSGQRETCNIEWEKEPLMKTSHNAWREIIESDSWQVTREWRINREMAEME